MMTAALALAKTVNHTLTTDPIDETERYVLHNSAVYEVTAGDAGAALELSRVLMRWACDLVSEVTRHDTGAYTPAAAIRHLNEAVSHLLKCYIDAHEKPGIDLGDGSVFHVASTKPVVAAMEEILQAVAALNRIMPPPDPQGGQEVPS
jgi:hypothetical protein